MVWEKPMSNNKERISIKTAFRRLLIEEGVTR